MPHRPSPPANSPETWPTARRVAERVFAPIERFLHVQAASGILLLAAAAAALFWANSPWASSYQALWHTPIGLAVGGWSVSEPLHFWINDGLMVIFFFVVGLEIRRELHEGELSDARRAALPVAAALGGMVMPALIFIGLNAAGATRRGWGVPTATDIAFAVGVLALLGKRVPPALRVMLLALAIIDDLGAIVVIALFYSSGVTLSGLAIAAAGSLGVVLMQRLGVRRAVAYAVPGVVVWIGFLRAGIHPTIAGVILGLLTPVRSWFGEQGFLAAAHAAIDEFRGHAERRGHGAHDLVGPLHRLHQARREALPPVVRVEAALHPWVAYGIMPLFAFANAGVTVGGLDLGDPSARAVVLGVVLGLVLGKPAGIMLASFLSVRLGVCVLPRGVDWKGVLLVGSVAGIGFTMAIFIAGLAFPGAPALDAAKLGVLLASGTAAVLGTILGRAVLPAAPAGGAAMTVTEAEASTEQ